MEHRSEAGALTPGEEFLTPAQLAKRFPIARSSVYAACQAGLLTHYRLPAKKGARGKYLVKLSDFVAWLESNRHDAGAVGTAPIKLKHL
ncbi:MAG: hypothetical protein JWO38_281 [Gemmataceae bacterium]|nr:hypothetical protein [Gemmataceae bacterium]